MMLPLALSVINEHAEVIPEVKKWLHIPDNLKILQSLAEGNCLPCPETTKLLTHKDAAGKTILEDETLPDKIYKELLALALNMVNKNDLLVPEVKREIAKVENLTILQAKAEEKCLTGPTISNLLTHKNDEGQTILEDETLAENTYKVLFKLALSALKDEHDLVPIVKGEIGKPKNWEAKKRLEKENHLPNNVMKELGLEIPKLPFEI